MSILYQTYILGGYRNKSTIYYFNDGLSEATVKNLTRKMLDVSVENKYILDKFMKKVAEIVNNSTYPWKLQQSVSSNPMIVEELHLIPCFKETEIYLDIMNSYSHDIINGELISYILFKLKNKKIYFKEGLAKKVLEFYNGAVNGDIEFKRIAINYKIDLISILDDLEKELPNLHEVIMQTNILDSFNELLSSEVEHTIEEYPIKYAVIEKVSEELCFLK